MTIRPTKVNLHEGSARHSSQVLAAESRPLQARKTALTARIGKLYIHRGPQEDPGLIRSPLRACMLNWMSVRTSDQLSLSLVSLIWSGYGPSPSCSHTSAPPNCPLRNPKYHLIETIRPLIEVHWGVLVGNPTNILDQVKEETAPKWIPIY